MNKKIKILSILVAGIQCFIPKICYADGVCDDLSNSAANQAGFSMSMFFDCQPTDLHLAAQQNNVQIVADLIENQGVDPSLRTRDEIGATPLHYAIESQAMDVVRYLIAHGAELNTQVGLRRLSPLHIAAQQNNFELVNLLVSNGAEIDIRDITDYTPLMYAVEGRNTQNTIRIVDLLLNNGADIQVLSTEGENVLLTGFRMDIEVFDFLLRSGADTNIHNVHGEGLLHFAACRNSCDLIRLLIQNEIVPQEEINRPGENGRTPIFYSVWEDSDLNFEMLQALIQLGADTNAVDNDQNTLLHHAVCAGQDEDDLATEENYINVLVERGIDVNSLNANGQTPLMLAASHGNIAAIDRLIRLGADVTIADNQGQNFLNYAQESDILNDVLSLLMGMGVIVQDQ